MNRVLQGINNDNIVNESTIITIGGVDQHILIRGNRVNNPIILFLHGGPGIPSSPNAVQYQTRIEDHFLVINWDQRGAGKSYYDNIPKETMNLEQFVSDTAEVIDFLLTKFNRKKLYIAGQSFGSIIGLDIITRYPEKFYAYIGIGQVIDLKENEKISYDFLLEKSKEKKHVTALKELEEIGAPPYANLLRDISIQRKWLNEFDCIERKCNIYKELKDNSSDKEFENIVKGASFTATNLLTHLFERGINFFNTIQEIEVPAYFCMGRYDYASPSMIVDKYVKQLKAPKKECIWFEHSAHFPDYEEPVKFVNLLLRILEETYY
ncbi:alpha/beta fold hydrolase [Vallitalea okinawensis]|uniref:alpha/beta fold hydrolase n=1 Tax=Vallitalea okinawensis TaxID=2078660 RepID=UPI000CFD3FC3|nr:alpha/beta hydrolase [Vallitalea okinawensis]